MKSLLETYPEVAKWWHDTKNGDLTPGMVSFASAKKVWWKCSHGHEWESRVFSRTKNGSGCPYCAGKKADGVRNFEVMFPEAAAEWHSMKNHDVLPCQLPPYSGKKVWWQCKKGHEWVASVVHRSEGGGCPYCCGQKVSVENCLVFTHPLLLLEWDAINKLTPYDVNAGSHKSIYWRCPKADDHVWQASVCARVAGSGCPCCAGQKIVSSNCLATTHPSIAAEWHRRNELTPHQVTYASNKMAWFQCLVKPDHVWRARIVSRTTAGRCCPFCASSKGEQAVKLALEACGSSFKPQYKFDDCKDKRRLPFDFAVLNQGKVSGLIEFHGRQHFEEIAYFGGSNGHKGVIARDAIKKAYCEQNGLPLLVVPHWKIEKINVLVKQFLVTLQ